MALPYRGARVDEGRVALLPRNPCVTDLTCHFGDEAGRPHCGRVDHLQRLRLAPVALGEPQPPRLRASAYIREADRHPLAAPRAVTPTDGLGADGVLEHVAH